jgi:hypothetical protein
VGDRLDWPDVGSWLRRLRLPLAHSRRPWPGGCCALHRWPHWLAAFARSMAWPKGRYGPKATPVASLVNSRERLGLSVWGGRQLTESGRRSAVLPARTSLLANAYIRSNFDQGLELPNSVVIPNAMYVSNDSECRHLSTARLTSPFRRSFSSNRQTRRMPPGGPAFVNDAPTWPIANGGAPGSGKVRPQCTSEFALGGCGPPQPFTSMPTHTSIPAMMV